MKNFVGKFELIKILMGASALVGLAILMALVWVIGLKYIALGY